MAQCYDKTWPHWRKVKLKWAGIGSSSTGCWQLKSTCTSKNYN